MYEIGIGTAFIMWLYRITLVVVHANSRASTNLRQVGLRYSWVTREVKWRTWSDRQRTFIGTTSRFFCLMVFSVPVVFLSWLYVFYVAVSFLHALSKNRGAPKEILESRWRLRNTNMSFDEMIEWLKVVSRDERSTLEIKRLVKERIANPVDPHRLL